MIETPYNAVKVYKKTISTIFITLLHLAMIFLISFVYPNCSNYFVLVLVTIGLLYLLWSMVNYLKHFHDKIIVTDQDLIINYCEKLEEDEDGEEARDVILKWTQIKEIEKNYSDVWIFCKDESVFKIRTEFYDTFFIGRQLQKYHEEFGIKEHEE